MVIVFSRLAYSKYEEEREISAHDQFDKRLMALQSTWPTAKSAVDCEQLNGKFLKNVVEGKDLCIIPTKDAGKSCKVNHDCETFCDAGRKKCHPEFNYIGHCFSIAFEDGMPITTCID
jgi:hypothetical protein